MFFAKVETPGLAHVAYLIGDGAEVAIVDPRRDVEAYLALAQKHEMSVAYVIETHRHEDFVLGAAEIARRTGAKIVCGDHERFGRADVRLRDGEAFTIGSLTLRALHTPGHTPESTSYAVHVEDAPGRALGVLTGDALFVGASGRVDLLGESEIEANAGALWDSVHQRILPLGDQALVWPAHGPGSPCGSGMADRDVTTLGIERAYNPVFTQARDAFVEAKKRERIPRPPQFARIADANADGGLGPARSPASVPMLSPARFGTLAKDAVILDTREPEAFAGGHVPGSINVWSKGLAVFAGWLVGPEQRVFLVLPGAGDVEGAVQALARIGVDRVEGVLAGGFGAWRDAGMPVGRARTTDPRELEQHLRSTVVLDVRDDDEVASGRIPGALHAYVGRLESELDRLRPQLSAKPNLVVTCSVGHRSGIATSLLLRRGLGHATNLLGGMTAWKKLGLPTTT